MAWVKFFKLDDYERILSIQQGKIKIFRLQTYRNTGRLQLIFKGEAIIAKTEDVSISVWTHISVTKKGDKLYLYSNSVKILSKTVLVNYHYQIESVENFIG